VVGVWPVVSKYGPQVDISGVESIRDRLEWIGRLLQEVPGVGAVTAERLVSVGPGLPDLLDAANAVGRLVRELGLRPRLAAAIVSRWRALGDWERTLERALREAQVPAPVRGRIDRYLRECSLFGQWAEIAEELEPQGAA
jgi:hypothetical protein